MGVPMERMTLTIREVAEALGISEPKARELAHTEGFPAFPCGRRLLVSKQGLVNWLASKTEGGAKACNK